MRVAEYVMETLREKGVEHVFMVPGGGCMHLLDALGRSGIGWTVCLHEQAAAFAAQGYAEVSGKLGVVMVTSGPGATNAMTGVASAWVEGTPMLVLGGQARREHLIGNSGVRSMGPQEVNAIKMVEGITKRAHSLVNPEGIGYELECSVHSAMSGRKGPVWLEIPLGAQEAEVKHEEAVRVQHYALKPNIDREITRVAAMLRRAKRPVMLIGNGARGSGVVALGERLGVPMMTTWKAADMIEEEHPLFAGRPGTVGQRGANMVQEHADLMIIVGARMDLPQVAFDRVGWATQARKVMVDVDQAELRKQEVDVPVCCEAALFVELMGVQEVERKWEKWLRQIEEWKRLELRLVKQEVKEGCVDVYEFYERLSVLCEEGEVIVPGSSGGGADAFMQVFKVKKGQRIIAAPGWGAMGTALPMAIGAAIAAKRRVVCVCGDGGLQVNVQEMETMRRLRLPIVMFVLSNGGYASIKAMQHRHFEGRLVGADSSSGLTLPDVVEVARAYDVPALSLKTLDNLPAMMAWRNPKPLVYEVKVSDEQVVVRP